MDPLHVSGADVTLRRLRSELTNWRLVLVRLIVAGLAVVITFLVVPGLTLQDWHWGEFWIIAITYGLLNAIVKPLLQFFALRYLIATYGLVVIVINAVLLWLLATLLAPQVTYSGLLALLIGGALIGLVTIVLETLLGTTRPIVDTSAHGFSDADARPGEA